MAHLQFMDELVKEYLTFRGLTNTLKALENELKTDKDKGFRIDKVVDSLFQNIYTYNLQNLRSNWSHLEARLFSRLGHEFHSPLKKLENALLKFYLVNATENDKSDKVSEFFVKLTPELASSSEWKDWFALPYIKNPEDHPNYSVYFTRQWQESLQLSLHNLLAAVYQHLPQPVLSSYEEETQKVASLLKENEMLKKGLVNLLPEEADGDPNKVNFEEIHDDFFCLAQELKTAEVQAKSLKSFLKKASPITRTSPSCLKKSGSKKVTSTKTSELGKSPKVTSDSEFLVLSRDEYRGHCKDNQNVTIFDVKINKSGTLVASLDSLQTVHVWDLPSGNYLARYEKKGKGFISWLDEHLIWVGVLGQLELFHNGTHVVQAIGRRVNFLKTSLDDRRIVYLSDGAALRWDIDEGSLRKHLSCLSDDNACVEFLNPDIILCGKKTGLIAVCNITENCIIKVIEGRREAILHIAVAKNYCFTLSASKKFFRHNIESKQSTQLPYDLFDGSFCVNNSGTYFLAMGKNCLSIIKTTENELKTCLELRERSCFTCIDWFFVNQTVTCVAGLENGAVFLSTLLQEG